jgi:hypothetical protein
MVGKKLRRETTLKYYKFMSVPILLYKNATWIMRERYRSGLQTRETRFLRSVKNS